MREGIFEIDGVRLEWARWGPKDGPQVVLLHEGLGCVALWRAFPAALVAASGLGVLAYSRAGYGRSDPCTLPRPLDYMTREAVGVLPRVLEQAGIERFALLGHSDGGTIAAEFAGRVGHPGLFAAVLIAPHFFTEPGGLAAIAAAREAYEHGDLRARLARYHSDVDCAFRGWNEAWLSPRFRDWDVQDALDTIACPVLAIQGEADPYGTLRQVEVIAERVPAPVETLILPGVGHAPHLERAEEVTGKIASWLRARV